MSNRQGTRHPLRSTSFLTSASSARQLGDCHAEVALVGRSNVGKSSLLNALAGQPQLARVSRTPGRTRLINVFATAPDRWIVDLPGYGYAAGPRAESDAWRAMVEGYLLGRPSLRMVFVLVDAEVGPTKLDLQLVDWLRHVRLPHRIVAAKADQVRPGRHVARHRDVAAALCLEPNAVAWVSSKHGKGLSELRSEVTELLELR
jgi:GTP-binding protein